MTLEKKLKQACEDYIAHLEGDWVADKLEDYQHYIFEAAMEWRYGEKIWDKVNKLLT